MIWQGFQEDSRVGSTRSLSLKQLKWQNLSDVIIFGSSIYTEVLKLPGGGLEGKLHGLWWISALSTVTFPHSTPFSPVAASNALVPKAAHTQLVGVRVDKKDLVLQIPGICLDH